MKQRIISIVLALCVCLSVIPAVHADYVSFTVPDAGLDWRDSSSYPAQSQISSALTALQSNDDFKEGTLWDDANHTYAWHGGVISGNVQSGTGCAAFAFAVSDYIFGTLPAREVSPYTLSDVRAGDILHIKAHTVIVTQATDTVLTIAEGNLHEDGGAGKVHWGRQLTLDDLAGYALYTRYPADYEMADADETIKDENGKEAAGTFGDFAWRVTNGGTLYITGTGDMPAIEYNGSYDNPPWADYAGYVGKIVIGSGVTSLSDNAFRQSGATSVTIPASVTAIGDNAFRGCTSLTVVTIEGSGLKTIGVSAFQSCGALTAITIPASIETVGDTAFFQCEKLKEATFKPGTVKVKLGDALFARCYELSKVTLPKQMTGDFGTVVASMNSGMFMDCHSLASVIIPDGAEGIGMNAFANCEKLTTVWIPDTVTRIGEYAFTTCGVTDIYYTGTEEQWNNINQIASVMAESVTVHYESKIPETPTDPDEGDDGTTTDPDTSNPGTSNPGSSSSSGSSSTTTTTTRNPDGSTTTTKTDHRTGTVTETTKNPDGTQTVVETQKDGTVTTRETDPEGGQTVTVLDPDGSSTVTVEQKDGVTAVVSTDSAGRVEAEVSLTAAAVSTAQQNGDTLTLPIPKVQPAQDTRSAPAVTVNTGSAEPVRVEIPAAAATAGTVAVMVHADGTEEIVKTSVPTADGVVVSLPDGATVKLVDNSRDFADVPAQSWAADAICFAAARELFAGTGENTFAPEAPMTRAMLMTVLARFDGADTAGGAVWYEKGVEWAVENGVSDGSGPDQDITREQLVTMLWRYIGSPSASDALSSFTDADEVSGYAQEAMRWAVENGIVNGSGDGSLSPQGQATRAQVAQILMNFIEKQF